MDKASDFESEDCEFESRRGRWGFKKDLMMGAVDSGTSLKDCTRQWLGIPKLNELELDEEILRKTRD